MGAQPTGVNLEFPLFKRSSQRVAHNPSSPSKVTQTRMTMEKTLERTREKLEKVPVRRPKGLGQIKTSGSGISPKQEFLLNKKFAKTINPLPTEIHELVQATGLTKWKIQRWFRIERTKLKERREKEKQKSCKDHIRSTFIPVPLNAGTRKSRTPDGMRVSPNRSQLSTGKLVANLKVPDPASPSLKIFRADLNRIGSCPIPDFQRLLKGPAQNMAKRIFTMFNIRNDVTKPTRLVVMKESQILNGLIRLNPFSLGQKRLLGEWRQDFIRKVSEGSGDIGTRTAENGLYFKNYISPWIIPLIYSRLATQTRLNRSIRVAIRELSQLCGTESTHDWDTPLILHGID